MEPRDSPAEAAFRAEARVWLSAHAQRHTRPPVAPSTIVAEWKPEEEEENLARARAWQRRKFDAGWAGINWPAAYGGRGGTAMEAIIFRQEESAYDVGSDALAVGIGWCGPAVLVMGTEFQRRRYLPPLLAGDEMWCQLFSEPSAGSDLAGLSTRATRDGDDWTISGQKVWSTFAHRSKWGLCIARHTGDGGHAGEHVDRHGGLTAFIVDLESAGVICRPLRQMTDSSNFNEVYLDEVRVPDDRRVGEVGDGWRVVITTFMYERMAAALPRLSAIDALADLVRSSPMAAPEPISDLYLKGRVLQFTSLRALTTFSMGRLPGPEGSLGKLVWSSLLTEVYDRGLGVLGAHGLLSDHDAPSNGQWQDAFLGAPGLRIGGGTDQIQRNIIAERILGLPRDPRSRAPG